MSLSFWPLDCESFGTSDHISCRVLYLPGSRRPTISSAETSEAAGILQRIEIPAELSSTLQALYNSTLLVKQSKRNRSVLHQELERARFDISASALLDQNHKICRRAAAGKLKGGERDWLTGPLVWSGMQEGIENGEKSSLALGEAAFWCHVYDRLLELRAALSEEWHAVKPSLWEDITASVSSIYNTFARTNRRQRTFFHPMAFLHLLAYRSSGFRVYDRLLDLNAALSEEWHAVKPSLWEDIFGSFQSIYTKFTGTYQ